MKNITEVNLSTFVRNRMGAGGKATFKKNLTGLSSNILIGINLENYFSTIFSTDIICQTRRSQNDNNPLLPGN